MPIYATEADLTAWLAPEEPPANADRLLSHASRLVAQAIRAAVYPTTSEDLPTSTSLATACKEATLTQVEAWIVAGITTPGVTGKDRRIASKSLGAASVTYQADPEADAAWRDLASGISLVSEATLILDQVGLLQNNVQSIGARVGRPYDQVGGTSLGMVDIVIDGGEG